MSNINFFSEEVDFKLPNKTSIVNWIKKIIALESNREIININYIFCSDDFLSQINFKYLSHNTLTDIITFNNSDDDRYIDSDIYISIDRVFENSFSFNADRMDELHRVMIHGILHLLGYKDSNDNEKKIMRKKENECLNLLSL
ncbi:MAG: rRNA maturation RNase YbeY [Cyclobacteriaceae bacterium]|jgi:rRNA maturation RNase YbeY